MAKTKISQFDATASNNTDLNSISIAEGTAPSNINNAIRELMSQLADLNLGNEVLSTLKIDNLHLDGNTIVTLDTNGDLNLTPNGTGAVTIAKADINGGTIDGTPIGASSASTGAFSTLSASSTVGLGSSVTISGGNIDGVIGANTPAAITGTVITANTNFAGNLTGNVTGTVDGVVGGTTPAAVTGTTITANTKFVGAIDGNVTATGGTSTFNNVTINGTLDMDSTTSQTITGLATPSGSTDAATKGYVDTEVSGLVDSAPAALNTLNELAAALGDDASFSTTITNSIAAKLPLAGGTMTGDIDANSNTVSGLKAPSSANDATTKTYVDTADALKLNLSGGTLSGNLAMGSNKVTGLDTPTATGDATTKGYVDGILGSATAAATSASAASTSQTAAATSATASATSATAAASSATSAASSYDAFDDRYLGAKGSAPTVDNDGDALLTGALYFNTSSNQLFVWTSGDAWVQAAFTASGFLSGANNLSDVANAGTSRTNLGLGTAATTAATDYATAAQGTKADNAAAKASNLSDLASASTARTNLGLGTAATLTAGTSANNAVQLDGSAKLPAVDGSALTGLASGGTVNMVADGDIAIRKPVVLTAAGKAKEVAETTSVSTSATVKQITDMDGSDTSTDHVATAYEASSERFVMFYRDTSNSNYPTLVAGSWSSGTVTWGSPHVVESSGLENEPSLAAGDGYVFASYDDGWCKLRVFSISGTSFTQTAAANISDNPSGNKVAYVPASAFSSSPYSPVCGVIAHVYSHGGSPSTYVQSHTLNISNGTIAGSTSEESFMSTNAHMDRADIVADPDNGKVIYATFDGSDGDVGKAFVIGFGGTASSPTDTVGTGVDFSGSDDADYVSACYDTQNNKVFITWRNDDGSNPLWKGTIGTINAGSNSISYTGTATIWDGAGGMSQADVEMDTVNNKIMFFYRDDDNSDILTYKTITSGASSFSVATGATMSNGDVFLHSGSASFGANKGFLVGLNDRSDSNKVAYSTAFFASSTTTNLDNGNYLGIAAEAISDTATGKINVIGGTSTGHSSLTIGNHYFTNAAGTIGLVGNTFGEQYLGRAISATEIQLLENEGYLYGTAEGAVTAGKPVVVEADGDFAQVAETTTTSNFTYAVGTAVEYLNSDSIVSHDVAYDSYRQKVILATHASSAGKLQVYVGTVTGGTTNSISWGSAQDLQTSNGDYVKVAYDPVSYQTMVMWSNGGALKAYIVTEDGDNTVTVGSVLTITGANGDSSNDIDTDLINVGERKWVVVYKKSSNGYLNSRVLTTSGTTISEQTETTLRSADNGRMAIAVNTETMGDYATSTRLVCFMAQNSSSDLHIVGATIDGNSITSAGTLNDVNVAFHMTGGSAVYDPVSNRFACAMKKNSDGSGRLVTCLLDGSDNSISSVSETEYEGGNTTTTIKVLAELGKVHICYGDRDDSTKGKIVDATINSGTGAATYGTREVFFNSTLQFSNSPRSDNVDLGFAFDSDTNRFVVAYSDDATADGFSVVGSLVGSKDITTTSMADDGENYIGIATKTVADDAQVEVATFGQIDAQQSGLTAGQKYFVQSDGSLGTSADASGLGSGVTVVAGKALSATKLLISE